MAAVFFLGPNVLNKERKQCRLQFIVINSTWTNDQVNYVKAASDRVWFLLISP